MLSRIQAQLPHLSKAERRVGEWILRNPQEALRQDTRWLAQQVDVSQPTIVRLAHTLGCSGFQEFRLKLAQELGESRTAEAVNVTTLSQTPDAQSLYTRLFDYSMHSLGKAKDGLDASAVEAAIKLLDGAKRVAVFGYGNAVTVADECARRLLRVDLNIIATNDPHQQGILAARLKPGDLLIVIAHEGRAQQLLETAALVRSLGASVVAMTTSGSPLESAVDVALCIDVPDSGDALTPMVAQLSQLVLIDVLSIGVATRRSRKLLPPTKAAPGAKRTRRA